MSDQQKWCICSLVPLQVEIIGSDHPAFDKVVVVKDPMDDTEWYEPESNLYNTEAEAAKVSIPLIQERIQHWKNLIDQDEKIKSSLESLVKESNV